MNPFFCPLNVPQAVAYRAMIAPVTDMIPMSSVCCVTQAEAYISMIDPVQTWFQYVVCVLLRRLRHTMQ